MKNKIFIEVEENYEEDLVPIAPTYDVSIRVFILTSIDTRGIAYNTGAFYTALFNLSQYSMLESAKQEGVNTLFKIDDDMEYMSSYRLLEILHEAETYHNLNKVGQIKFYIGNDCRVYYHIDYGEYEDVEEYKLYKDIYTEEGYEFLSKKEVHPDFVYSTKAHKFAKKPGISFKRPNRFSDHYKTENYMKLTNKYIDELSRRIKEYESDTVPLERKMWEYLNSITIDFFTLNRVWSVLRDTLINGDKVPYSSKGSLSIVEKIWKKYSNRMFEEQKQIPETLKQLYHSMKSISDEETNKLVDEFTRTIEDRVRPCTWTVMLEINQKEKI